MILEFRMKISHFHPSQFLTLGTLGTLAHFRHLLWAL